MKSAHFLILLMFPIVLTAQQKSSTNLSIGLFTENQVFSPGSNQDKVGVGLFARKGTRESSQWRFQLLYSNQSTRGGIAQINKLSDTDIHVRFNHIQHQGVVGVGREVSRLFYKNIRLLAAIDARLGYAAGRYEKLKDYVRYDTLNMSYSTFRYTSESVPNMSSSVFSVQTLPSIGIRIPIRKVSLTAETGLLMSMSYGRYKTTNSRSILTDMDITGLMHRLIIAYAL